MKRVYVNFIHTFRSADVVDDDILKIFLVQIIFDTIWSGLIRHTQPFRSSSSSRMVRVSLSTVRSPVKARAPSIKQASPRFGAVQNNPLEFIQWRVDAGIFRIISRQILSTSSLVNTVIWNDCSEIFSLALRGVVQVRSVHLSQVVQLAVRQGEELFRNVAAGLDHVTPSVL